MLGSEEGEGSCEVPPPLLGQEARRETKTEQVRPPSTQAASLSYFKYRVCVSNFIWKSKTSLVKNSWKVTKGPLRTREAM